jgi:hypothetical protein
MPTFYHAWLISSRFLFQIQTKEGSGPLVVSTHRSSHNRAPRLRALDASEFKQGGFIVFE